MFETNWRARSADRPLYSLPQIAELCAARYAASRGSRVRLSALSFDASGDQLYLPGKELSLCPTNWAMSQLALLGDFPWAYLARLPAHVAMQCINASLAGLNSELVMLWANTGASEGGAIRRFTPHDKIYNWDSDTAALLSILPLELQTVSWARVSDRNLFICLISNVEIADGYRRGLLVWNSEVGQIPTGLRAVMVHGESGATIPNLATDLFSGYKKIEVVGAALKRELALVGPAYLRAPLERERAVIDNARRFHPEASNKSAASWMVGNGGPDVRRANTIIAAASGDSAWDFIKTGAELSARDFIYADERSALDVKLGRLLEATL